MTALDAIAIAAAKVQYDRARRDHQQALLKGTKQPISHTFAYRRLVRFAPSETIVVREIGGNEPRDGMWR